MEMKAEHRIAASPQEVWEALNDVDVLKAAIPGCESLDVSGENAFQAKVTTKIGPVKAKFNFNVSLTDLNPPHSYTINAEGQGGAAGFANGGAAVTLEEDGADTLLAYHAEAHVGGKLAQLGARLIDGTAKKLADEFFTNFSELVAGDGQPDQESSEEQVESQAQDLSAPGGVPLWIWVAIVGMAGLVVFQFIA